MRPIPDDGEPQSLNVEHPIPPPDPSPAHGIFAVAKKILSTIGASSRCQEGDRIDKEFHPVVKVWLVWIGLICTFGGVMILGTVFASDTP